VGCGAKRDCRRSAASRQFRINRAGPNPGYGNTAEYSPANEYSGAASDWSSESANFTLQRSRIKLDKPAIRGEQHATSHGKSEYDNDPRHDSERFTMSKHAGCGGDAKRISAQCRIVQFGCARFRLVTVNLGK
jgi:hypothetical protein